MDDVAPAGPSVADASGYFAYKAPPIVEALVQLLYSEPLPEAKFRKLVKRLKREYANEAATEQVSAKIDFTARGTEFEASPQIRLSSTDEVDALVAAPHALTWTRLAPYEGWPPFRDRIQAEMAIAHEVTGFRPLARIGVRYVNRIDLPKPADAAVRFEDYLTVHINLPPEIPVIQNYAWRFEAESAAIGGVAIVQSAPVAPELPETAAFLLDVDVVSIADLPSKPEDVRSRIEAMRQLKNKMFELCISDKARERFQQ